MPSNIAAVRAADNRRLALLNFAFRYDQAGIAVCAYCGSDWTEGHRCLRGTNLLTPANSDTEKPHE